MDFQVGPGEKKICILKISQEILMGNQVENTSF